MLYDSYDYGGKFDNVVQCPVCEVDTVLTITEWNKRPVEDALAAERDALRAELAAAQNRIAALEDAAAELSLWLAAIRWDGSQNTDAWLDELRVRNERLQKMLPDLHGMEMEE